LPIERATGNDCDPTVSEPCAGIAREAGLAAVGTVVDDAKEGIQAFKEKRPPVWEGR